MANGFEAFPYPVAGGGFLVMLRFPKDGQPKPVLSSHDRPHIVPTEKEAWAECTRHLLQWVNGKYRCEMMGEARSEADAMFPGLKPIRRNGRVIEVQRKGARA